MAAPNLTGVVSCTLKHLSASLGTSTASVVTCPQDTSQRFVRLVVGNGSTTDASVSVSMRRSSVDYAIYSPLIVPARSSGELLGVDIALYLESGDQLVASSSITVPLVASYEEIYSVTPPVPTGNYIKTEAGDTLTTEAGDRLLHSNAVVGNFITSEIDEILTSETGDTLIYE